MRQNVFKTIGTKQHWLVLLCIIIGVAILHFVAKSQTNSRRMLVDQGIYLKEGHYRTSAMPDKGWSAYDIVLWFYEPENVKRQVLDCLTGMEPSPAKNCDGRESIIDISWTVYANIRDTVRGREQKARGQGSWTVLEGKTTPRDLYRKLGTFKANKNATYEIDIQINKDASILDPAVPVIVVYAEQAELNRFVRRWKFIDNLSMIILGVLVLGACPVSSGTEVFMVLLSVSCGPC